MVVPTVPLMAGERGGRSERFRGAQYQRVGSQILPDDSVRYA
jgi:hypothetical protein